MGFTRTETAVLGSMPFIFLLAFWYPGIAAVLSLIPSATLLKIGYFDLKS